jgi:nodulation protein E
MTDEISNNGVVVTGMGLVTPIGVTVETFWSSLLEGRCGIGPVEGVEGEHLGLSVAAQIKDYDPRTPLKAWQRDKTILHSDRYSWLAAAAADQAIKQSTLELPLSNPYRAVCIIGSAAGGQMSGERGARDRFVDNKRAVHPMSALSTGSRGRPMPLTVLAQAPPIRSVSAAITSVAAKPTSRLWAVPTA